MNKRHLHHIWKQFRKVSHWYFLAGFLIFGTIAVFALRQNNLNAITLRDQVIQADKDNGDVEKALRNLREYIYSHMNTNLSTGTSIQQPIQLKYRYERLTSAEKARVDAANSKIYSDAQKVCEAKFPGSVSGGPRVPCIQEYVTTHGSQPTPVPDSLYKFSFVSPRWSPDLAGLSLLTSIIFLILFIFKFITDRMIRTALSQHE